MSIPAIPPSLVGGREWSIDAIGSLSPVETNVAPSGAASTSGSAFGDVLTKAVDSMSKQQTTANDAVTQLATGQSTDPTQALLAIERARLGVQVASQIRNKSVEAIQEIFHSQV